MAKAKHPIKKLWRGDAALYRLWRMSGKRMPFALWLKDKEDFLTAIEKVVVTHGQPIHLKRLGRLSARKWAHWPHGAAMFLQCDQRREMIKQRKRIKKLTGKTPAATPPADLAIPNTAPKISARRSRKEKRGKIGGGAGT